MTLPVTLSGAEAAGARYFGGPLVGGGAIYAAARLAAATASVAMFRATDPAAGFTEQNSAGRPDIVVPLSAFDMIAVDGTLHCALMGQSGVAWRVRYVTFATATNEWGTAENINNSSNAISATAVSIGRRSSGEILVASHMHSANVKGSDYERCVYARRSTGGSWTVAINVHGEGNAQIHLTSQSAVMTAADRFQYLFRRSSDNAARLSTILSNNNFGQSGTTTPAPVSVSGLTLADIRVPIGKGIAYDDGGTTRVRFPVKTSDGRASIVGFDDGDNPTPTVVNSLVTAVAVKHNAAQVALCSLVHDGTTLRLVYVRDTDDDLAVVEIGDGEVTERTLSGVTALSAAVVES